MRKRERNAQNERLTAAEKSSEHCVNTIETHDHDIKELQRIYATQALQLNRQSNMIDTINQELDSRRSQISKMDSWIRHDIEDQVNVLNKRVKTVERSTRENKEAVSDVNLKIDGLDQMFKNNNSLATNWNAKTEAFMRRIETQWKPTGGASSTKTNSASSKTKSAPSDISDVFETPSATLYKKTIMSEVEHLLAGVEDKVRRRSAYTRISSFYYI